jgi:hypothetical protein
MSRIVWIVAAVVLTLWTLLSWGTYLLLGGASELLAGSAGWLQAYPEWQGWLEWSVRLVEQFGVVLLWIVWALGALATLAGAWIAMRLARTAGAHANSLRRA